MGNNQTRQNPDRGGGRKPFAQRSGKGPPRRASSGRSNSNFRSGGGGDIRKRIRPQNSIVDVAKLQRGPASRFQALAILVEADESSRYVDQLLEEKILSGKIHMDDKHLVQEVVFGSIRHRSTIDQVLDNYLQFSMTRQHVTVRWALRLATYQLVYLSRIPSHAAIHGTIEAIKAVKGIEMRDVGFANAVLRRIQNDIELKSEEAPASLDDSNVIPARHGWCYFKRPILPRPTNNRTIFLSIKYSHPKWLMSRWVGRFGEEDAIALCMANNRVPLVTAILTEIAPPREEIVTMLEDVGVVVEEGILPDALRLRKTGDIRMLEPFAKGWIRIQDETAKSIGAALEPAPGSRVLDLCAAPGAKAAQLLELIGEDGHLVACDSDKSKLPRLRESLERVGSNFTVMEVPKNPRELSIDEKFSYILVDVPCSNTGVLARRPEARWRIHSEDFPQLVAFQGAILDSALRHLAPGGRIVYSTCSIEPEENGQVVAAARLRHSKLEEEGSRLFLPHRDGADGGYFCILRASEKGWAP